MDDKTMTVVDEQGTEYVMTILFTYEDPDSKKNYVFYCPENDTSEETPVFVAEFDEEGNLRQVTDDDEMTLLERVLSDWQEDQDEDGEEA